MPHTLSDGTTVDIKVHRGIASTVLEEVTSRKRKNVQFLLIGERVSLVFGNDLISLNNPAYNDGYAPTLNAAKKIALQFCIDSAEAVIAEASKDGLPVEQYYTLEKV